jgi:hypothetical protein
MPAACCSRLAAHTGRWDGCCWLPADAWADIAAERRTLQRGGPNGVQRQLVQLVGQAGLQAPGRDEGLQVARLASPLPASRAACSSPDDPDRPPTIPGPCWQGSSNSQHTRPSRQSVPPTCPSANTLPAQCTSASLAVARLTLMLSGLNIQEGPRTAPASKAPRCSGWRRACRRQAAGCQRCHGCDLQRQMQGVQLLPGFSTAQSK